MNLKRLEVFLEFLIFGVIMNLIESLIAIVLTTGQHVTLGMVAITILVVIPFAAIGELIVDKTDLISTNKKR